ncbi:MAG: hypothetical protein HQK52_16320 [Oligoflexia bacterium]|nr:hypothetical protein [Oligoflexia bacterium]
MPCRFFLLLLALFIAIHSSIASVTSRQSSNEIKSNRLDPNIGSQLHLGTGYNSIAGITRGLCVERIAPEKEGTGYSTRTDMKYIDSYKLLAENLSINSSANLKIGSRNFTAGGVAGYFEEQKIESRSVYFVIRVIVTEPVEKMMGTMLRPYYANLLKNERGAEEFFKKCGDEYTVAIQKGGAFYSLIKISSSSEEEQKKISLELKAALASFASGSTNIQQAINKVIQNRSAEMTLYRDGGYMQTIPIAINSIDEVLKQASTFEQNIKENGGLPVLAITEEYSILENYPIEASPARAFNKKQVIENLSDNRYAVLSKITDIEYILTHPGQYDLSDVKLIQELNKVRSIYAKDLVIITNFADQCFSNLDQCRLPTESDEFIFPLIPDVKQIGALHREKCLEWLYKEGQSSVCGVKEYSKSRGPVCGIESYKSRRDEICGVEIYKEQQDEAVCGRADLVIKKPITLCGGVRAEKESMRLCKEVGYAGGECKDALIGNPVERAQAIFCYNGAKCRDQRFGVEQYKICSHPSFGVDKYVECAHPSFGVLEFNTCRSEVFGNERCLRYAE